eukprot:COSAG03_NODE_11699_length_580_cov_0.746362_1_plen_169_part_01
MVGSMGLQTTRTITSALIVLLLHQTTGCRDGAAVHASERPSLLFGTSGGLTGSGSEISEDFVRALYNGTYGTSFEVDCTGSVDELTRERIFQYDAIVLFSSPHCCDGCRDCHYTKGMTLYNATFAPLVAEYARAGGGVFLWPSSPNVGAQPMFDLTEQFEVKLPLEQFM